MSSRPPLERPKRGEKSLIGVLKLLYRPPQRPISPPCEHSFVQKKDRRRGRIGCNGAIYSLSEAPECRFWPSVSLSVVTFGAWKRLRGDISACYVQIRRLPTPFRNVTSLITNLLRGNAGNRVASTLRSCDGTVYSSFWMKKSVAARIKAIVIHSPAQRCCFQWSPPPWGTKWYASPFQRRNRCGKNSEGSFHKRSSWLIPCRSSRTRQWRGNLWPSQRNVRRTLAGTAGKNG